DHSSARDGKSVWGSLELTRARTRARAVPASARRRPVIIRAAGLRRVALRAARPSLAASDAMSISYPRQSARTRRSSLGVPRAFRIAPDETRVAFLRTKAGDDPVTCLWTLATAAGEERCVVDPSALDVPGDENLPAEERARRERAREQAGGIVGYATDRAMRQAVFTLAGRLYVADLDTAIVRELPARAPVFDPRPDPAGRRIAYVS